MTFDLLPPQAYTKETLLKAYNWLQTQSDQVKELATTPDQLVSLFLKSTRLGQDSLQRYTNGATAQINSANEQTDRPSLQNFKSELKNLAGLMGDLEKPVVQTPPPHQPMPAYQGPQGASTQVSPQQHQQVTAPTNAYVSSTPLYDETTQILIREVKNELNLSTDTEALRMLVKIGYQKVRSLYK